VVCVFVAFELREAVKLLDDVVESLIDTDCVGLVIIETVLLP